VLRENLIRPAAVDVSAFATGPWDNDLMAPPGFPCPHWHGSIQRTPGGDVTGLPVNGGERRRGLRFLKRQ